MPLALRDEFKYSYKDYKNWEGDWELIDGVPVAMAPAPMVKHQKLASYFIIEIGNQLDDCMICDVVSEVDYKVNDNTILRPDIALICNDNGENYITKAPEIVVEIISPSTARRDEVYKFDIYEKEKVKYYILVYPEDLRAKIYKLDGKSYDKVGDFDNESYSFDETICNITIDFEKLFKRFKR